jgi:spermidine synthase
VLGAALANHALVPVIGLQGSLVFLTLICVAVAGFNLYAPANRTRRYSVVVAGAALLAVLMRGSLPDLMALYNHQVAAKTGATSAVVRLAHEGRAANVSVIDLRYYRIAYRDMFLNGVSEASTRYWHTQVFKLLGALPVLLHEEEKPKDALVIAFGAGMTAGSVLVSDQVSSLDVVDLNPDVEGINDLFREVNGDVFHQPRFHFHNDDGRNFLVTNARRYDLIISDSTHPHAYDSWVLYTREFYQSVRKRLLPGGIFAQWVPVDANIMQGELFRIHLNTFRSVFPNTVFWLVAGSDQGFLLATPGPLVIDPSRLQQRLDRLPGWFRAKDYQIDTVPRLAGFFWLDGAAISRVIGNERRINTDDLHYFDQKDVISRLPPESRLHRYQASLLPHLARSDNALRAKSVKEQVVAQHLARYFFLSSINDLISAYCQDPENGKVLYYMAGEYPKGYPDYATICRGVSR